MEHVIENIILSILLTLQCDQVMWFKHLSKSKQDMTIKIRSVNKKGDYSEVNSI